MRVIEREEERLEEEEEEEEKRERERECVCILPFGTERTSIVESVALPFKLSAVLFR